MFYKAESSDFHLSLSLTPTTCLLTQLYPTECLLPTWLVVSKVWSLVPCDQHPWNRWDTQTPAPDLLNRIQGSGYWSSITSPSPPGASEASSSLRSYDLTEVHLYFWTLIFALLFFSSILLQIFIWLYTYHSSLNSIYFLTQAFLNILTRVVLWLR